jgi:chromosome segregation ATPase
MSTEQERQELERVVAAQRRTLEHALILTGIYRENIATIDGRIAPLELQLAELHRQRNCYEDMADDMCCQASALRVGLVELQQRLAYAYELASLGNGNATSSGVSDAESPQVQTRQPSE